MGNSYEFIKKGSSNLIVTFASNAGMIMASRSPIFEFVNSLEKLDFESDLLFLKDAKQEWYLGSLAGVGENVQETTDFLDGIFSKYDKIVCMGCSAGGYASLLYGSLLKVNCVIAFYPQTDLNYLTPDGCINTSESDKPICRDSLRNNPDFEKYNNLMYYINDSTEYNVMQEQDKHILVHGPHHYNIISHFPNVKRFDYYPKDALTNGFVENTIKSHFDNI